MKPKSKSRSPHEEGEIQKERTSNVYCGRVHQINLKLKEILRKNLSG